MKFENVGEITKSLWNVRKHIVQPTKDAKNPFFKSNYVTLEGVVKAIDEAIEKSGEQIFWTQEVISDETNNMVGVKTYVLHSSGQFLEYDELKLPTTKRDAQAFGSASTYAKRYALSSVFGITSDVDDDGNKAKVGIDNMDKSEVVKPTADEISKMQDSVKEKAEKHNMSGSELWKKVVAIVGFDKKSDELNKTELNKVLSTLNKF